LQLELKKASESPPIQEDKKIKNHDQFTSNSDIALKNLWDVCLTDPEDSEETALELARPNRCHRRRYANPPPKQRAGDSIENT
jgi:hypothetical protein